MARDPRRLARDLMAIEALLRDVPWFVNLGRPHPRDPEVAHFHDDGGRIVKNRVAGYALTGDGKLEARANKTEFVGDSGVMTTVGDLLLWDQNLHRDKLGKPGFLDQLLAPGKLTDGKTVPYALGLNLGEYRGLKTVWHAGSASSGFRSMYL